MEIMEDGGYGDGLVSIEQYEKDVDIVLNRFAATEEELRRELRKYTLSCAKFLRSNGIEDNSKAGFVSAIVLGLTNKDSRLYRETKFAIDRKMESKSKKMLCDPIGKEAVKMLKTSLYGDGKANLFNCSSLLYDSYNPVDDSGMTYMQDGRKVPLSEALKEFGDIDIAMINPPYSIGTNANKISKPYPDNTPAEVVIQKGQDELDFIASMLHYIKTGGIGIAIVPMSCAGNSGKSLRKNILKFHTLLACMTMPSNLFFDSHVGTATCIMVFKAHIPHDEKKAVFFARWQEDGFQVIPHNGRKDTGEWANIRVQWMEQIDGVAAPNDYVYVKHKIKTGDEALAEAYIKTDYSKLSDVDFERTLKKYALYKYMGEQGMLEE